MSWRVDERVSWSVGKLFCWGLLGLSKLMCKFVHKTFISKTHPFGL